MSAAAHAALIALAVAATGNARERASSPDEAERAVWVPPRPPADAPADPPAASRARAASAPARPARAPTTFAAPTLVPEVPDVPDVVPPTSPALDALGDPAAGLFERSGLAAESAAAHGAGGGAGGGIDAASPHSAREVDREVALTGRPPRPRYPDALRAAGVDGRVVVRFVVDTAGRVERGSVTVPVATHPLFAAAVEPLVHGLRFRPAEARGRRVRQLVEMPFEFVLRAP